MSLLPEEANRKAVEKDVEEGAGYHDDEGEVVLFAYTVVDPVAVVVEVVDAPVAHFAVPRGVSDIAAASVAVETVLQFGQYVLFVAVAVSQHYSVSRVNPRRVDTTDHQYKEYC